MKRFCYFSFFLMLGGLMVACVGFTPSSAAENLAECMKTGNYAKAAENLAFESDATEAQKASYRKAFVDYLKNKNEHEFAAKGGIEKYKIVDEAVTPDESKAYVRIRYSFINGTSADEIIPLIKSHGRWEYLFRKNR